MGVITSNGAAQAIDKASQLPIMRANSCAVSASMSSLGSWDVTYPGRGKKATARQLPVSSNNTWKLQDSHLSHAQLSRAPPLRPPPVGMQSTSSGQCM